jgi:hypothetical protein
MANAEIEKRLQKVVLNAVSVERGPLGDLAFALAATVLGVGDSSKGDIRCNTEEESAKTLVLVCFEYMYFFLFATIWAMRHSLARKRSGAQIRKLQSLVVGLVVDLLLHSIPPSRKAQLLEDLGIQMSAAHATYRQSQMAASVEHFELMPMQKVLAERVVSLYSEAPVSRGSYASIAQKTSEAWAALQVTERIHTL